MAKNNPYIGPRTFQRNEGHLFFGREREARDLIALVASERLVVFYAQSGAGKSSIVNTRLIPNLESKEYEVLPVGRLSGDLTAGDGVDNIYVHNLIRSLEQHDSDPKTLASLTLADFLAHINYDDQGFFYDPTPLEVDPDADPTEVARRALIIDQFEELFSTYPESWDKRAGFFEQLAQAMEADPQLWIVLVMREDYIAALDPYAHILSNGLRARYYMQRLGREAALKAVRSPVEGSRPYAEGVAEKLIDDLCSIQVQQPDGSMDVQPGQYAEPVQMQVVCYGLWDNLPDTGKEITAQDLQDVGDVNQSLGKYYDKRVSEVAEAKNVRERLIREWFEKKLITAGGIRGMVLQEREHKPGELRDEVIQALQSDLVRAEKRGGATWYELTHDRLVEPVLERNRVWFEENLSPLQRQAALWKDQDQNETWLLTGDPLNEVEAWAKEHYDELTETENEFLVACRKAQKLIDEQQAAERQRLEMAQKIADEQARSARRARVFNVIASVLIVIALIATFASIKNARIAKQKEDDAKQQETIAKDEKTKADEQSNIAHSGELSTSALERADSQLDLAILLGVKANDFASTSQSQKALLSLFQKSGSFVGALPTKDDENVESIQYSPNGDIFASLEKDGVTLWNAATREKLNNDPINEHYRSIDALALSTDGKLLASGASDGTIVLWDNQTHKKLSEKPFKTTNDQIVSLAISTLKDKALLASASSNVSNIVLWDITDPTNPQQIGTLSKDSLPKDAKDKVGSPILLAINPTDQTKLASGTSNGAIVFWDVISRQPISDTSKNTTGNKNSITGLVFDHKGTRLISASSEGVFLWDINNLSKPPSSLPSQTNISYYSLAISPDDKTLASGQGDDSIMLWDISTDINKPTRIGKPFNQNNSGAVADLTFNKDGSLLVSNSNYGKVIFWNTRDTSNLNQISIARSDNNSTANKLAFDPNSDSLIASYSDSKIRYWDLTDTETPTITNELSQGHLGEPYTWNPQFSPDGSILKSYGEDGNILIDTNLREKLGQGDFFVSPDGNIMAYQTLDESTGKTSIHLKDIKTEKNIGSAISGQFSNFSPDSKLIAYQTYDASGASLIHLWDVNNQRELNRPDFGEYVAFSTDSTILVYRTSSPDNGLPLLNLWNIATNKNIVTGINGSYMGISPDDKTLIYQTSSADQGNQISLWDITKGVQTIKSNIYSLSNDGKILEYLTTSASGSQNQTLNILNTTANTQVIKPIDNVLSWGLGLSQNGKVLFYTTYDEKSNKYRMNVLNTDTGEMILSVDGYYNWKVESGPILAYDYYNDAEYIGLINTETAQKIDGDPIKGSYPSLSSDGKILIYQVYENNNTNYYLWDVSQNYQILGPITGGIQYQDTQFLVYQTTENNLNKVKVFDLIKRIPSGEPVNGTYLALSPDGKNLVTKSDTGAVTFWDTTQTSSLGKPVEANGSTVNTAALSPNGKTQAFVNADGINLQGIDGSNPVKPFNDHAGRVNSVIFSPDKKLFLSIGEDNKTIVWDAETRQPLGSPIPGGWSAGFSQNGKYVAVTNYDNNDYSVTIWDTTLNKQVHDPIPGSSFTFSPDEKFATVSNGATGNDNTTTVWDLTKENMVEQKFTGSTVNYSPDGKTLLVTNSTANPNITVIFNLTSKDIINDHVEGSVLTSSTFKEGFVVLDSIQKTTTFWGWDSLKPLAQPINGFDSNFPSTNFNILVVRDQKTTTTTLWDPTTQKQIGDTLRGIYNPNFSADGVFMTVQETNANAAVTPIWNLKTSKDTKLPGQLYPIFCSDSKTAAWFDPSSLKVSIKNLENDALLGETNKLDEQSKDNSVGITFSPNCKTLAISQYWNNQTYLWDIEKKDYVSQIPLNGASNITFSPDSSSLIVFDTNATAAFWDTATGAQLDKPINAAYWYYPNPTTNQSNKNIAGIVYYDYNNGTYTTTLWDLNHHKQIGDVINGNYTPTFTADGKLAFYDNKGIRFWDVDNNRKWGETLRGHTAQITNMVFSPDSTSLATLASDGIIVTELKNIQSPNRLDVGDYSGQLIEMAFSPDGNTLSALGNDGTILKWNLATKALVKKTNAPYNSYFNRIYRPILSPDGNYVVYEYSQKLYVWKTSSEKPVEGPTLTNCCGGGFAFTPDGTALFYNSQNIIFRWDNWNDSASTPKPERVFTTGTVSASSLGYINIANSAGYLLINYYDQSAGNLAQIWDLATGSKVGDPISGNPQLFGSSAETQIMIYTDNGKLINLDMNPNDWKNALCQKINRTFTAEEWKQNIGDGQPEQVCR